MWHQVVNILHAADLYLKYLMLLLFFFHGTAHCPFHLSSLWLLRYFVFWLPVTYKKYSFLVFLDEYFCLTCCLLTFSCSYSPRLTHQEGVFLLHSGQICLNEGSSLSQWEESQGPTERLSEFIVLGSSFTVL